MTGFDSKQRMAANKLQETVSFPCCGYTDAIKWNQFNGVVQCHMCGQVYTASPAAQPAQEPVACARCKQLEEQAYDLLGKLKVANLKWSVAHPWIGLTEEEIRDCLGPGAVCIPPGWSRLTRAIEAKLKEKNA
jgi:hypothetical protein